MNRLDQRREVDEAISYESLCSQFNREDVDEIAELIVDVLCTTRPTLRIGGEELPIAQVKDRFYKLDSGQGVYLAKMVCHPSVVPGQRHVAIPDAGAGEVARALFQSGAVRSLIDIDAQADGRYLQPDHHQGGRADRRWLTGPCGPAAGRTAALRPWTGA